jgi:fimbrial isopeptide formation D2 family protein/uncharacterized repeat protein (TIGR01451 family)
VRLKTVSIGAVLAVVAVGVVASPAYAVPTVHEITADWADSPAPTDAPYGVTRTAEFHISTNDAADPYTNDPVSNVRATLTATNGTFSSIPAVCETKGVTPVSAISNGGTVLLCNLGTITEGTASVIQAPVKSTGVVSSKLSVSGTVTSDSATASAGPAATPQLPITGTHGMDLVISAPNQNYQQTTVASRSGGNRQSVMVDYGIAMTAGSMPGPSTYSFTMAIGESVPGQLPGLQWEGCGSVDASAQATGIPYSSSTFANRTNVPTCSISGSGSNYTVTLSGLNYSLQHVPTVDSLGNAIPSTTNFIAAGQLIFSYTTQITQSTGVTFTATPNQFTYTDGVTQPETDTTNDASGTTLVLPGAFAISWQGSPTAGRSPWDANLWAAPGEAENLTFPWPAAGTSTNPGPYTLADQPLGSQADSVTWSTYTGAGGADMAGSCSMVENPAAFVPEWADFVGVDGASYSNITTAHIWYRKDAIDTKTETCGEPVGVPGSPWTAATIPPGCASQTASISPAYSDDQCLVTLPPGVTAVKMTWNPGVDKQAHHMLRVWGYVPSGAPVGAESWTVGAFNAPYSTAAIFGSTWPNLNNYINISTNTSVYANIPGSTYGPNTNGQRDAMRIQGPEGVITKTTPDTSAEPGVPVTYNLTAESDSAVQSPPAQTFTVTDTLPTGMTYDTGSGTPTPALSTNGSGQQVLTYTFTDVPANAAQPITYQASTAVNSAIAPGTVLTNTAEIDVPGDNRPAAAKQATASVTVPNSGATTLGKSSEAAVLSYYGDSSAWDLTINSQDPVTNPFTDTIDVLPYLGDGRGTTIGGSYSIGTVTAPAGSTVYYTSAPSSSLSLDPRSASNGGTPGSITGDTVGWSTTEPANVTGIRIIGPALNPGATQSVRIAYTTPAGSNCAAPEPGDNKPGQVMVNSATTIAGHTALPMRSSATVTIGDCYAVDIQKYVLRPGGNPTNNADWLDADTVAQYPQYAVGATVPYRIVVTNKGTGVLTNVVVTDPTLPTCSYVVAALAVGASAEQQCSSTAVVGTTVNTASVTTTPPDGGTLTGQDPAGIVVPSPYTVSKSASPANAAVPVGGKITYTIEVTEPPSSAAPFPNASFTDDLSDVLDDATYDHDVAATAGTASVSGNQLTWSIPGLMPGQTATITYSVTVKAAALTTGNQTVTNTVTTPTGDANCDSGSTDAACSTTNLVPSYTVEKSVNAASAVAGDTLTYTITVRNTGPVAYPATGAGAASFSDSLAGVNDDGVLVPGSATATAGTVSQLGSDLMWSGPLAVPSASGSVVTIQYQVSVTGDGDKQLVNSVAATGHDGACAAAGDCATDTPVASYEVSKTSTPAIAYPGGVVSYTITVRNTGAVPYTTLSPATFTDDLTNVLDDATIVANSVHASAGSAAIAGNQLTWSGPLDAAAVTVTYQAQVADAPTGDLHLINTVSPTARGGVCSTAGTCTTDTPIREFTVAKTAGVATAAPGAQVTYTIVVTNTGSAAYTAAAPASFTDSLSNVLDDATYDGDVHATGGTAQLSGNILSWSGPLSNPGTVTITYSVTIDNPDHGDFRLDNTVETPAGIGGNCLAGSTDPGCEAVVLVRAFHVSKTVDHTTLVPGQTVTYTITVNNIGQVAYGAGEASFTDDLSQVLDDASYNGDATATAGAVSYTAPVLSWSGPLAVGGSATITYSVDVNSPDAGNQQLHNAVVTPTGSGSNCESGSTDPLCQANVPGPRLHVVKSVSAAAVSPGQKLTYTIELENTGQGDFTSTDPASFTDDLSRVLDDATYDNDADHGATYSAPTLSWSGALASGASIVITYSVTVKQGGDGYLDNTVVTPPGVSSNCLAGSTDPACFTRSVERSYHVAKVSNAGNSARLGQDITYEITVTNTGNAAYTSADPAGFVDDMTDVLDDGVYNGDATNGAVFSKPTLSWSGPLGVGAVLTVTYSVKLNSERTGNGHVYNSVESTTVGGVYEANCEPGSDGPECSTLTSLPVPSVAYTGVDALQTLLPGVAALLLGAGLLLMVTLRRRRRGIN